jgi:hypothetical protein
VNEMALTWSEGIIPLGISRTHIITFDSNKNYLRRTFWRHDLKDHYKEYIQNYLSLQEHTHEKKLVRKIFSKLAKIENDY